MRSTQTKKAICLRKARFLPCLPFIYRFFSLPNRAPLLKQRCGYGNHLKCHSEEQSDVGIPKIETQTQWRLPLTALVLAISTAQPLFSLKIRGTKTQASIPSECLLGGCRHNRLVFLQKARGCVPFIMFWRGTMPHNK